VEALLFLRGVLNMYGRICVIAQSHDIYQEQWLPDDILRVVKSCDARGKKVEERWHSEPWPISMVKHELPAAHQPVELWLKCEA
jgi:hypothetical protein